MASEQKASQPQVDEDDEVDEWCVFGRAFSADGDAHNVARRDQRIFSTGCAEEQLRMNDCYYEKKDWRVCRNEMEAFRQCWKRKGNEERTQSKDVSSEK